MSGALAIVVAAATTGAEPAAEPLRTDAATITAGTPEPLLNSVAVAIPSVDGLRGVTVRYERFVPEYKVSLAISGAFRQSAAGDYTGLRVGGGAEARIYWRAAHKARLARLPAGSMVGWFAGTRFDMAVDGTRDNVDDRWLDTAIEVSSAMLVGYRFVPWRQLEITPTLNGGIRHEFARRLPGWTRGTFGVGLDVGWLF